MSEVEVALKPHVIANDKALMEVKVPSHSESAPNVQNSFHDHGDRLEAAVLIEAPSPVRVWT